MVNQELFTTKPYPAGMENSENGHFHTTQRGDPQSPQFTQVANTDGFPFVGFFDRLIGRLHYFALNDARVKLKMQL